MIELAEKTIAQFRDGKDGPGNQTFVQFIDKLTAALQNGEQSAEHADLPPLLEKIAEAQGQGDYIHVADLLEYELIPILK